MTADLPRRTAIGNRSSLLAHGQADLRRIALDVAEAGLAACDPALAVERLVRLEGDSLVVDGRRHRLEPGGRIVVLGSGKASVRIGHALEAILGDRIDGGTIVVRHPDPGADLKRVELIEAGHPLPDERSATGARRILDQATALGEHDLAIACFTGGSSALTSLPPPGVSFADKRELHRALLASGMPIGEVNAVRKQVSAFKGGRMAAAVAPARLINLTISDVAGDELETLSDPSVPNLSSVADAIAILHDRQLWDSVPASIRAYLADAPPLPQLRGAEIHSTLIVTGQTACEAMSVVARDVGATPVILSTSLEGEASALGRTLGELAAASSRLGRPHPSGSVLLGCGGESTVRLRRGQDFGLGGPNQELALAVATHLDGADVAAAFLDTDGSDGGTELAGAIVDGASAGRAREGGIDIAAAISGHRSGEVVVALGDGIETGPTHTNVNDLFVLAIG